MIPKFDLLPRQCGVDLPRTWAFGSFSGSLYTASIEVRETGKGGGILKGCRPCRRPLTEETAKLGADGRNSGLVTDDKFRGYSNPRKK